MHKHIITAAANIAHCFNSEGKEVDTFVLVDSGHYGNNMRQQYELLRRIYNKVTTTLHDQGFIDNNGTYYNRKEAYKIAKMSGQYFNEEYTLHSSREEPELDSSCIRHFKEDVDWEFYKGEIIIC